MKSVTKTLFCLILTTFAGARGADEPIGMVIQAKGDSTLSRGGQTRTLQMADLLYPGDVLTIGGQLSFLFCPESKVYAGAAGSTIELTADQVRGRSGAEPSFSDARRCSLPQVAIGNESLERAGAVRVRSAGIPEVALLLGGRVCSSRPVFQWRPVDDAANYRLTLRSQAGDPVWETETQSAEAAFPVDRPGLQPGFYEWEVAALLEERTVAAGLTRFEVVPDPEMAALTGQDSLPAALELENQGFYAEAAAIYRKIRGASPADGRFDRHLAWLYLQAGLNTAAQAEEKVLASR